MRSWSSPVAIGAGTAGLVVLAVFAAWERVSSHPMLNLEFFRNRRFSAAVGSVGWSRSGCSALLQIRGALGVAVIGSLLNTRYQDTMTSTLAPYQVPHAVMQAILGSVGLTFIR